MAPDKIYIPNKPVVISSAYSTRTEGNDVEYIRKDALLDWAERMKSICKGAESIVKAYQTVIDKIESL